jgi:hypothetical protein
MVKTAKPVAATKAGKAAKNNRMRALGNKR